MIPIAEPIIGKEEINNVLKALKSGWVSSKGKYINEFEEKFSGYCNTKYGVTTSNGTTALHLAFEALGIGKGDEVLIPALSFIATANAVTYTGAKPIFVDINRQYWGIDPEIIEQNITKRTKAIVPVHLYGHPADMSPIIKIAKKHNLYVIEDAAEAHGAEYKGKKVGSLGDIACFSFFGNKIMTCGEGGMCLTNDKKMYLKMKMLRDHGMDPKKQYWHKVVGFNYRMTNLQAALGLAQLKKLDKFIKIKRENAGLYNKYLSDLNDVVLPSECSWARNIYWIYTILINSKKISNKKVMAGLKTMGIESRPVFYPFHMLPPYKNNRLSFPVAEYVSRSGISLPSGVGLSKKDIIKVSHAVRGILR